MLEWGFPPVTKVTGIQPRYFNEKRSGFWIGLSITQNLVKNFKGSLSVDWKDGTIYFTASLKSLKQSSRGNATT
ncbi:hypothetical protein L0P10_16640, partial [Eggerthella lenta]|nr:hypothetical protein [Eggerthella lenta]